MSDNDNRTPGDDKRRQQQQQPARFQPPKLFLVLLLAFGVVYLLVIVGQNHLGAGVTAKRSNFDQDLYSGFVAQVDITDASVRVKLRPGTVSTYDNKSENYQFTIVEGGSEELDKAGAGIQREEPEHAGRLLGERAEHALAVPPQHAAVYRADAGAVFRVLPVVEPQRRRRRAVVRQEPGEDGPARAGQGHVRRRRGGARGQGRGQGDNRVSQEPEEVPAARRAHPARDAAYRGAGNGQDATREGDSGRSRRAVLQHLGLGLRGDVRRRRRFARARPLSAGQGKLALHHLPGRDRRGRAQARPELHGRRPRRARTDA